MRNSECYVYMIGCPHSAIGYTVKVGLASNPHSRIRELQTGNAEYLELLFCFRFDSRDIAQAVERSFHETFDHATLRGEWFGMNAERALFHLAIVTVRVLSERYPGDKISDARARCGLHDAFEVIDVYPDEKQTRYNEEWAEIDGAIH